MDRPCAAVRPSHVGGDRIFLNLLERGEPFFDLTLRYRGETLERAELNGRVLNGKDLHP